MRKINFSMGNLNFLLSCMCFWAEDVGDIVKMKGKMDLLIIVIFEAKMI